MYLLNAVDGCIPSDLSTGTTAEIDEERRLLYVAMTRAKDHLTVVVPQRFYVHQQGSGGDRHVYASRTRFIPDALAARFHRTSWPVAADEPGQLASRRYRRSTLPRECGACGREQSALIALRGAQSVRPPWRPSGPPGTVAHNGGMKTPGRLQPLVDEGLIDTVVRQLMSGKEAAVYVVRSGEETRCAKVYKEATHRSFRQAVDYTENRKVKNTRQARAMAKGTRFGRQATEAAWQSAEVESLYRLAAAGVRVPKPFNFLDGVLLMELVTDAHGDAAPRLNDVLLTSEQARAHHATLIREVVRMLAAGVVHGDLSEFNVLLAADGPMIIDLPQAVDAAGNNHASRMLLRDVANLRNFFGRFAPDLLETNYGAEIWDRYVRGDLNPDVELTGRFVQDLGAVDLVSVMREVDDALAEEKFRRQQAGRLTAPSGSARSSPGPRRPRWRRPRGRRSAPGRSAGRSRGGCSPRPA